MLASPHRYAISPHPAIGGLHLTCTLLLFKGSVEAVQHAADAVMVGGALDSLIDAVEFVRKKSDGGNCILQ